MKRGRGLLLLTAPALTVMQLQGSPTTTVRPATTQTTSTTRPTTTTRPGFLEPLSDSLTTVNSVILVLFEWLGLIAFVFAVVWLLRRRTSRQLVVPAFTNTSGLTELHTSAEGLGQLLRERLVDHLEVTQQQLRDNAKRTELESRRETLRDPMPVGAPDQRVSQLVTSLKAYVPTTAGPAVQLLSDVFLQPAGTRVTGTVQGDGSGRLGITLELTDLGGKYPPSIETIWAAAADEPANSGKQAGVQQAAPAGGLGKQLAALAELYRRLAARVRDGNTPAGVRQAKPSSGPPERLNALLDPAARLAARRVTALELLHAPSERRERQQPLGPGRLQLGQPSRKWSRPEHEALVRNVTGMLLQSDALGYHAQGHAPFFFGQAMKEFNQAVEAAPGLYQPYENRADTAALRAQFLGQEDPEDFKHRLRSAMADYQTALENAKKLRGPAARTQVEHRLQIGLVLAQRRFNDPTRVEVDIQRIPALEAVAAAQMDDQLLYNLACWFGLDFNLRRQKTAAAIPRRRRRLPRQPPPTRPDPRAEAKALRYLAYCLARAVTEEQANDRANDALSDSDLQLIPKDKIRRLRDALAVERQRDPRLQTTVGQPFEDAINRALAQLR